MSASTTGTTSKSRRRLSGDAALALAARIWFCVAVAGQLVFVFAVVSFYGRAAVRGNLLALNSTMTHGYIPADPKGNLVVAIHLALAALITVAGAIQLMPQVRRRAPVFHRWNGRFYIIAAFAISLAGLYMLWARGTNADALQRIGISLNALLIMLFAGLALRYAIARDFATHRRWALRLFIVVSGVWFLRLGAMLSFLLMKALGDDPTAMGDTVITILSYAAYLGPLAILELYLRTGDRPGTRRRLAMASGLFGLTAIMAVGILTATMALWLPNIEAAYASRATLDEALSTTIRSKGVAAAVAQYRALRTERPAPYNFDQDQLNTLGYELLRAGRSGDAVRILQLNVQAYPRSANGYDSLGEAYMDDGNKAASITNYRKSLALDPRNRNAVEKLHALGAN